MANNMPTTQMIQQQLQTGGPGGNMMPAGGQMNPAAAAIQGPGNMAGNNAAALGFGPNAGQVVPGGPQQQAQQQQQQPQWGAGGFNQLQQQQSQQPQQAQQQPFGAMGQAGFNPGVAGQQPQQMGPSNLYLFYFLIL